MEGEKDGIVNAGVVSNDGFIWLGIGVAVVKGRGNEKDFGEAINNSFVSMVRWWTGALCWGASKYCTSGDEPTRHLSSNEKRSSSIMDIGASL